MDAGTLAVVGGIAAAVISGITAIVARRIMPRVERDATIVESALNLVKALRDENRRLKDEIKELRDRDHGR